MKLLMNYRIGPLRVDIPQTETEIEESALMSFLLTCDCGKELLVQDEYVWQLVKCPDCGNVMDIPGDIQPYVNSGTDDRRREEDDRRDRG